MRQLLAGLGIALLLVGARVAMHVTDKRRIARVARMGRWRGVEITWLPFGPGWFGENGERHYRVRYVDSRGTRHDRRCKTSLLTGVYWRD